MSSSAVVRVDLGVDVSSPSSSNTSVKAKKRNLLSCPSPPSRKAKRPPVSRNEGCSSETSWASITEAVLTSKCLCSCEARGAVLATNVDPPSIEDLLDKLTAFEACVSLLKRQKTAGFLCSSLSEFVESFLSEADDPPEESLVALALTSDDEFVSYSASRAALALMRFKKSYALAALHKLLKAVVGEDSGGTKKGFGNCFASLRDACSVKEAKEDESACPPETCEICLVDSDEENEDDSDSEFSFGESDDEDEELGDQKKKSFWDASTLKTTFLETLSRSWARIVSSVKVKNMLDPPFISLWTTLVSIHSNVPERWARSFVAPLASVFSTLLAPNVAVSSWRATLDTYNEALCYGSTIALLDEVPDEPLTLAKLVLNSLQTFLASIPTQEDFSGLVPPTSAASSLEEPSVLVSKSVLLILKAAAIRTKAGDAFTSSELSILDSWVKSKLPFHPSVEPSEWIVKLLSSQDDVLVEALVCSLDVYSSTQEPRLSPHSSFAALLATLAFDYSVLLDYLVSDDTYFLLYLLRFLKLAAKYPQDFKQGAGSHYPSCLEVLSKLRDSVSSLTQQQLFPYNVSPLLKVLDQFLGKSTD